MPDNLPSSAQELVAGMQLCSSFMSGIMNNLLDARKIEEGKMELRRSPLTLSSLLEDIRKMTAPATRPGVELKVLVKTEKRDCVYGDVHRLKQVLNNLVNNSIKHTTQGYITLVAGWEDDLVRLEVQDSGPGIPVEEQDRVFDRFVTRGGAPGSGLGLTLCKKIVHLMNGSIHFESDPSTKPGTTCILLLPLQLCEREAPALSTLGISSVEAQPRAIEESFSMLIVDDIRINRTMLIRRIRKGIAPNCSITEAATGEQALEICEKQTFDVIIMDNFMEQSGGILVGTDAIRQLRRSKVSSMIIGCSGNDLEASFLSAGADLVWSKPTPSNAEIIKQLRDGLNICANV